MSFKHISRAEHVRISRIGGLKSHGRHSWGHKWTSEEAKAANKARKWSPEEARRISQHAPQVMRKMIRELLDPVDSRPLWERALESREREATTETTQSSDPPQPR